MIDLDLSEEDIDSLLKFAKIEHDKKELIISIINSYKKAQSHRIIMQEIADTFDIDFNSVETFINSYISLVRLKWEYKLTNEELLSSLDVNLAMIPESEYEESDLELLRDLVVQLMNISNKDTLISTLAYGAVYSNNNIYYYSDIFEELRPVFLDDEVAGLASYHTLQIHYEAPNKKHTNIYLVIDDNDIDNLIALLTKAKAKTESLKIRFQKEIINI